MSAPYVVLGAAAQRTKRLRLGVAVNTLPVHHPVQLAEEAAMLDLVSGGRMDFAAGGGHPHSRAYECFGADHKSTHDVMAEGLQIIRKAWSEESLTLRRQVFSNSRGHRQSKAGPETAAAVLHGDKFARRRRSRCALLGINLFLPIHTRTPDQVYEFADAYWAGLKKHGHDPKTKELGLLIPMHLAKTTAEAKTRSEAGVMSYFKTILDLRLDYTDWLNRRGVELPARLRTAAGSVVGFDTVCEKHAVIGDSNWLSKSSKS